MCNALTGYQITLASGGLINPSEKLTLKLTPGVANFNERKIVSGFKLRYVYYMVYFLNIVDYLLNYVVQVKQIPSQHSMMPLYLQGLLRT